MPLHHSHMTRGTTACTGARRITSSALSLQHACLSRSKTSLDTYLINLKIKTSELWAEAQCLYANTTAMDWTLTITSMVTTRHTDGEDIATHIAKMKTYCHDLILMQRDIDDELFACFLRISMPTTWNYVFAALPDHYSSAEVEWHIRDEYGVRMSQSTSTSTTFQVSYPNKTKDGCSRTPVPGQPYCMNCRVSGHRTEECYSKG